MKCMRTWFPALWVLLMAVSVCPAYEQKECRCHSKRSAMKRMHEAIGFANCGNCHSKSENLMSGNRNTNNDAAQTISKKRFTEDQFCIPCHDSQGAMKKNMPAGVDRMNISGTLYCAKDKLRFPAGTKSCPNCGSSLININEFMEKSRAKPSNQICMECHLPNDVQAVKRHGLFNAAKLQRCLDCHKGHDNCGGCHH